MRSKLITPLLCLLVSCVCACADDAEERAQDAGGNAEPAAADVTLRADVEPITSVTDAKKSTFVPPFLDCRDPLPGETTTSEDGKVCTHVAISGCTEPGKHFSDYGSCDVVRTQRPFWPIPPAKKPSADDPRTKDAAYMKELAWVTEQVQACACSCCHDSKLVGGTAGEWDISLGPIWMDTLSNTGLALFSGLADSSVLGAYPKADNHGFDRMVTGLPSDDSERMRAFMLAELERRGISQDEARATPPFGGPIYTNRVAKPKACTAAEGIDADERVLWTGGKARYVYVLEEKSENPGVPPNLDLPDGALWRLDVLASADAVESGVRYGTTPEGSFQAFPETERAPRLKQGSRYHLYVLLDVGVPLANCIFENGAAAASDGSAGKGAQERDAAAEGCTLEGGDESGFGVECKSSGDDPACACSASYCALQPGQTTGYCTKTGCKEDASICPDGWACFDVSVFAPGQPSICTPP